MTSSAQELLSLLITQEVEKVILRAERSGKPLELDPYRRQLFKLFVRAHESGILSKDAEIDLTAENLCRVLSKRWGLSEATKKSVEDQTKLPDEHLSRMRLLWSMMRLWMEWTYAWDRWKEFHGD